MFPLVQAVAQVILDGLYVWAILLAIFVVALVTTSELRRLGIKRREAERIARIERKAETKRVLLRSARELEEAQRYYGVGR